jgi:hypothetical protein
MTEVGLSSHEESVRLVSYAVVARIYGVRLKSFWQILFCAATITFFTGLPFGCYFQS